MTEHTELTLWDKDRTENHGEKHTVTVILENGMTDTRLKRARSRRLIWKNEDSEK
jgi:hypothetical protein